MKSDYKKTFDAVQMTPQRSGQIRAALSARISEKQKGDSTMNAKLIYAKKLKVAAVAAAMILALTITAVATHGLWQPVWAEYFGMNISQQKALLDTGAAELIDGAAVDVKSLNTEASFTITVEQVIGDRHILQILIKLNSDTPGAFSDEFMRNASLTGFIGARIDGQELEMSGGGGFIGDAASEYSGYFRCYLYYSSADDWSGKTVELYGFSGTTGLEPEEMDSFNREIWEIAAINPLRLENWTLPFTVQEISDTTTTIELGKSFELDGRLAAIDYVDISPISLFIGFADDSDKTLKLFNGELTMADGAKIDFEQNAANEYGEYICFLDYNSYEGILDVSEIVSISLTDWYTKETVVVDLK